MSTAEAASPSAVARVVAGGPFVASLVVAGRARHHLLRIVPSDVFQEARSGGTAERDRLPPMVRDHDGVPTLREREPGGATHREQDATLDTRTAASRLTTSPTLELTRQGTRTVDPTRWGGHTMGSRKFVASVQLLALTLTTAALVAVTAPAASAEPSTVTIAGSLQSELGCPGDWQPRVRRARTSRSMPTTTSGRRRSPLPAGSWEYKAALNGTWDENYGARRGARRPQHPARSSTPTRA